jgi:hypothetical protein
METERECRPVRHREQVGRPGVAGQPDENRGDRDEKWATPSAHAGVSVDLMHRQPACRTDSYEFPENFEETVEKGRRVG